MWIGAATWDEHAPTISMSYTPASSCSVSVRYGTAEGSSRVAVESGSSKVNVEPVPMSLCAVVAIHTARQPSADRESESNAFDRLVQSPLQFAQRGRRSLPTCRLGCRPPCLRLECASG